MGQIDAPLPVPPRRPLASVVEEEMAAGPKEIRNPQLLDSRCLGVSLWALTTEWPGWDLNPWSQAYEARGDNLTPLPGYGELCVTTPP